MRTITLRGLAAASALKWFLIALALPARLVCQNPPPTAPPGDVFESGGGNTPGDVFESGGRGPGDIYQSGGCGNVDNDMRHYIRNGTIDRCAWAQAHYICDPLTKRFGMPDHVTIMVNGRQYRDQYEMCVGDPCAPNKVVCWGWKGRPRTDEDRNELPNSRDATIRDNPSQTNQSHTNQSHTSAEVEDICDLKKLAGLIMMRYDTGFPIATVKVVNSNRPTYLVLLPGVEWQKPGQATMLGDALIGWSNLYMLDAYRLAIIDAVARLPVGADLILAGHSQGGVEAQQVVSSLVQRDGFKVPQIISFGAPIVGVKEPGTNYLHVRARDEPLQGLDRRFNLTPGQILLSNPGTGNLFGPDGSHNSYDKSSSGLNRYRVPAVSTLKTQCYEIDLTTLQKYRAPDLISRMRGKSQCPPIQTGPPIKRSYQPKVPLPRPQAAMDRGLLLADETYLKNLAANKGLVILVRDSSLPALGWIGRPGYKAKPSAIKGKTLKQQDLIGVPPDLVNRYLGLASAMGMTPGDKEVLRKAGYIMRGSLELISDQQGNKFYSDTDLHGVYDMNGNNAWSQELAMDLECGTIDQGIQHAPHDEWPDRNNPEVAKANYGPQIGNGKTITAIFPDGRTLQISTLDEMKQLYKAIGVNWNSVYPNH